MRPLTNIQMGTLGGTLCSLFASITLDDMVKTMVLAELGAVVSFLVSSSLARWKKRKKD